mgnify:CR=1 FL=1
MTLIDRGTTLKVFFPKFILIYLYKEPKPQKPQMASNHSTNDFVTSERMNSLITAY